jgi:hypothetical protein
MPGWYRAEASWWGIIRETIPRPWTREAALMDLRWMADREHVGGPKRPKTDTLAAEWGWYSKSGKPSEKRIRLLIRSAEWVDDHKRPAEGQRKASGRPAEGQPINGQTLAESEARPAEGQRKASGRPAEGRHARSDPPTPSPNTAPKEGSPLQSPQVDPNEDTSTGGEGPSNKQPPPVAVPSPPVRTWLPTSTEDEDLIDAATPPVAVPPQKKARRSQVEIVVETWEEERARMVAAWRAANGRKRGHPRRCGSTPSPKDPRWENLRKCLSDRGLTTESACLLVRWTFQSTDSHAEAMRSKNHEFLTPISLFRPTKLADKLKSAEDWADADSGPAAPGRSTRDRPQPPEPPPEEAARLIARIRAARSLR